MLQEGAVPFDIICSDVFFARVGNCSSYCHVHLWLLQHPHLLPLLPALLLLGPLLLLLARLLESRLLTVQVHLPVVFLPLRAPLGNQLLLRRLLLRRLLHRPRLSLQQVCLHIPIPLKTQQNPGLPLLHNLQRPQLQPTLHQQIPRLDLIDSQMGQWQE